MSNIEEKVEALIKPIITNIGYDLYDVIYLKEGKNYILRVVIDSDNGIRLDDCEKVNNEINDILDEVDYIKEQYYLEVSSPGVERLIRKEWQLKKYIDENIQINLFKKDENKTKEYHGILKDFNKDFIIIEDKSKIIYNIERKNISQIKTEFKEEIKK